MAIYKKWCELLTDRKGSDLEDGEFLRGRDELIREADDETLFAMAGLFGIANGGVVVRLRAEQKEVFRRLKARRTELRETGSEKK